MRKFSIPYNNDQLLLDELFNKFPNSKDLCKEIFFAISNKLVGTGRAISQSEDYDQEIISLMKKAKENKIESNALINSGCLGSKMTDSDFIHQITKYLCHLKETASLDIVTVSDYILAREIKMAIPELKLECSSIAYIDSLEKAKYWEDLGCDIMVVPPVYNKNLHFIEQLRNNLPNVLLKLVINQECLHGCPMWQSHHNLRGHGNDGALYLNECQNLFKQKPWLYYSSSYIPPKYVSYYDKYIDIYKLVDRKFSTPVILQSFGAYCGEESYQNKIDEWNRRIPEEIFDKVIYCDKNCSKCNLCEHIYKEYS